MKPIRFAGSLVLAILIAGYAGAQTTIYVSWESGDDVTGNGTINSKYKTIKKALMNVIAGETIDVEGGRNAVHVYKSDDTGEQYPLVVPADDITILSTRAVPPTISLNGAEQTFTPGMGESAFLVESKDGIVFENLRILADEFNKVLPLTEVKGVHVRNLPDGGAITLTDLEVDDLFHGIYFEDVGITPASTRTVAISGATIKRCGPPLPSGEDVGHAGIRLIETTGVPIDLTVSDCLFKENHDALEPGGSNMTLTNSEFITNENGLEYAAGLVSPQADVSGCLFERHATFGTEFGGGPGPTGGISVRGVDELILKVRQTDFDSNQIGVYLISGTGGEYDFGTSPIHGWPEGFSGPGGNVFITDPTNPWYPGLDHTVSYCGLFTDVDVQVLAVGNTWSHLVSDSTFSQGSTLSGQEPYGDYKRVGSLQIPENRNYDSETQKPPHRSLFGSPGPQVPGNYSTGPLGTILLDSLP